MWRPWATAQFAPSSIRPWSVCMLAVVRGRSNVRPLPSVVDETVTRSCNNTTISRTRNVRVDRIVFVWKTGPPRSCLCINYFTWWPTIKCYTQVFLVQKPKHFCESICSICTTTARVGCLCMVTLPAGRYC